MSEWQPIETAPKDGTRILLYNQVAGVWSAEYDKESGSYPLYNWGMDGGWYPEASHWMPVPKPPEDLR